MNKGGDSVLKLGRGAVMLDVEGTLLGADDIRRLQNPGVGGVILFSRNFENKAQLVELLAVIRSLRQPELLIAVDQEGGRVQRFREGFTRIPPMAMFGAMLDEAGADTGNVLELVSSTARLMAQELIECGVDFSLAPVLDLGLHASTVIGNRAFHANPDKLICIASAFIDGMMAAGMKATGKHFPGHGHVLADSHLETPLDQRSYEQIYADDMHPFINLKDKLGAVMTAHICFPEVDSALPAFSTIWLQEILRQQIAYDGLIFSDDLTMHGARVGGGIVERADLALKAGCDMLLVCNEHATMDELLAAKNYTAPAKSQRRFDDMKARPAQGLTLQECEIIRNRLSAATEAQSC